MQSGTQCTPVPQQKNTQIYRLVYLAPKAELRDYAPLVIIPYHHLHTVQPRKYQSLRWRHPGKLPVRHRWPNLRSILAFVGGNLGVVPPPTIARMLHLNSISTMPIPPLLNSLRNCTHRTRASEESTSITTTGSVAQARLVASQRSAGASPVP